VGVVGIITFVELREPHTVVSKIKYCPESAVTEPTADVTVAVTG
jgi:hypothetical protein